MADSLTIPVCLIDVKTGEEIESVHFPSFAVKPSIGESLHYWQDGSPEKAGFAVDVRRDFYIRNITHDLRYLPSRSGGAPVYVHSLVLTVEEIVEEIPTF